MLNGFNRGNERQLCGAYGSFCGLEAIVVLVEIVGQRESVGFFEKSYFFLAYSLPQWGTITACAKIFSHFSCTSQKKVLTLQRE